MSRKRVPLNQNECTDDFRIGVPFEQNLHSTIRYRNIRLNTESYEVFVDDKSVSLTAREFEILKLLLENQGRVFSRETLLNRIWNYDFFGDEKIVNTHIKNIRKKLEVDCIETIRGVGYRIEKEN